ncbi:hypothetical protein FXO37_09046 [Capsicum annuum]|nr:hypothetical protein FXO37_09046 [Capsicum annuum]
MFLHGRDLSIPVLIRNIRRLTKEKADLAATVRGNDILKCEVKNALDALSYPTPKLKYLKLQEVGVVKAILPKVFQERDFMWKEVKSYSEMNMLLNYEINMLKKKVDTLDEDFLMKEVHQNSTCGAAENVGTAAKPNGIMHKPVCADRPNAFSNNNSSILSCIQTKVDIPSQTAGPSTFELLDHALVGPGHEGGIRVGESPTLLGSELSVFFVTADRKKSMPIWLSGVLAFGLYSHRYYYNKVTRTSKWRMPDEVKLAHKKDTISHASDFGSSSVVKISSPGADESSSLYGKVSSPVIETVKMKNSLEPASPAVANSEKIGIAVTLGNLIAPPISVISHRLTGEEYALNSNEAMRAVINNRRYGVLKSLCERKQAFNGYLSQKEKLDAGERLVKQKKAREEFRIMLEDCKELSPLSRWRCFRPSWFGMVIMARAPIRVMTNLVHAESKTLTLASRISSAFNISVDIQDTTMTSRISSSFNICSRARYNAGIEDIIIIIYLLTCKTQRWHRGYHDDAIFVDMQDTMLASRISSAFNIFVDAQDITLASRISSLLNISIDTQDTTLASRISSSFYIC